MSRRRDKGVRSATVSGWAGSVGTCAVHKWGEMRFSVLVVSSHILLVGENTKNVSAGKGVVTQLC